MTKLLRKIAKKTQTIPKANDLKKNNDTHATWCIAFDNLTINWQSNNVYNETYSNLKWGFAFELIFKECI